MSRHFLEVLPTGLMVMLWEEHSHWVTSQCNGPEAPEVAKEQLIVERRRPGGYTAGVELAGPCEPCSVRLVTPALMWFRGRAVLWEQVCFSADGWLQQ